MVVNFFGREFLRIEFLGESRWLADKSQNLTTERTENTEKV